MSATNVCNGTQITAAASTCPAGTTLKLYSALTGGSALVLPATTTTGIVTASVGTFTVYAACAQNAPGICETPTRVKLTYTVVAPPATPTAFTLSKTRLCASEVASTTITILAHNCGVGQQPFVSTDSTGATVLGLAGVPFPAATKDTTIYYSFCKNTAIESCISSKAATTVSIVVTPNPIAPFSVSLSKTSACLSSVGTLSVIGTCSGIGETMEVYTSATDTTKIAYGLAAASASTSLNIPSVPNTSGTTTYYVQCRSASPANCSSARVLAGTFTVLPDIAAPSGPILSTQEACLLSTITANASTCPAGTTLKLYSAPTGGVQVTLPITVIGSSGDINNLYAVCVQTAAPGCETSTRTKVTYVVVSYPATPGAFTLSATNVCYAQAPSTMLNITAHSCLVSEQPFVSTDSTGATELGLAGTSFAAPTTIGTTNYFSFCKKTSATGCISLRGGTIAVNVNPTPIAPFRVSLDRSSAPCPTNVGAPLSLTATCSGVGETMEVYDVATGGTPIVYAAAPAGAATTVPVGAARTATTTYYVLCSSPTPVCVSSRVPITFTVGPDVAAPSGSILSATTVCQNSVVTGVSAACPTGTTLRFYDATGALASVPTTTPGIVRLSSTATPGDFVIFAACDKGDGCETSISNRTRVNYTVIARPATPAAFTLSATNVCFAQAPSTTLTITSHNCAVSEVPFVAVDIITKSPELGLAGAPFAAPTAIGATIYVAFCKNTITGCISAPGGQTTVTVNPTPITPFGVSLSKSSAPCPSNLGTLSATATCSGIGETMEIYTVATGDSPVNIAAASTAGPTTVSITPVPSVTTTYYVQCTSASPVCASSRVLVGTFTVGPDIAAPSGSILSATTVCQGLSITPVSAACTGTTLKLYSAPTGTATSALPTTTVGTIDVYAVCVATGGCETSTRTKVSYTVGARPVAPAAHTLSATALCAAQTGATTLTITAHNCTVSEQPFVSTSASGVPELGLAGASFAAPTVTTEYYSFCKNIASSCINSLGTTGTVVTVNPTPIAPFGVSLSKSSAPCPSNLGTLSVTATCSGVGETMEVYKAATGGTAVNIAAAATGGPTTVSITSVPSVTTTYYVQCTSAGAVCPSSRVLVGTFTVGADIAAPGAPILSATSVCEGASISPVSAACPAGTTLKLYSAPTGTATSALPTNTVGTIDVYAVCDAGSGCETSTRTKVSYTVVARPVAPSPFTLSATNVCAAQVASTALTITAHACAVSEQPFVSTSASGVPALGLAGASFAAPTVTTEYYSFCKNTGTGCNSANSASVTLLTVNPTPIAPFGVSLSKSSAPCPTNLGTLSVTATCSGIGETMEVYTVATGGTAVNIAAASAGGPTALSITSVPTVTTPLYVQCTSAGAVCASSRVPAGTFTVGAAIAAPSVSILSATTVCEGASISPVSAPCAAGTTLKLYSAPTGTATSVLPTTTVGTIDVYAVCDAGSGCETSTRTKVSYTVVARPSAPAPFTLSATNVCFAQAPSTTLTITAHNCLVGEQPFVSTSASGVPELGLAGAPFAAPTAIGTTTYRSFCKNTITGCNSAGTSGPTVTVNPTPIAPFGLSMSKNSAPCPTNVGTLSITATCSGIGETMEVYKAATGGTAVNIAAAATGGPTTVSITSVPTSGTTTYYVQCTSASPVCASGRVVAGTFTVGAEIAAPSAPILSATTVCQNASITAVSTACPAGTTLKLYSAPTGTATSALPTTTTGTIDVYAVCDAAGGCETTTRTKVSYTVGVLPTTPAAHTLSKTAVCAAQVPSTTLTITAHNCSVSEVPFVSTSASGVPELGLAGASFAAPSVTTSYFSFCKNTVVTSCNISSGAAGTTVTVNPTPIDPFGLSLSKSSAPCPSNLGSLSVTATCSGVGETMEVYKVATGGTALNIAAASAGGPTTVSITSVPTVTTPLYVQCTSAGAVCPSGRVLAGTFTVGADVAAGTVTFTQSTVCVGTSVTVASTTCPAGTTAKYYTSSTGAGTTLMPTSTPSAGTYDLWVVCDQGSSCESTVRTKVTYKVVAVPSAPTLAVGTAAFCLGTVATFTATHTCAVTDTLKLYNGSTLVSSQIVKTSPMSFDYTPTGATAGSNTNSYTVKCFNGICLGTASSAVVLTVTDAPKSPTFTGTEPFIPSSICALSPSIVLNNSLKCAASGEVLVWYDKATAGNIVSTPNVTPISTITYYVACRNQTSGCESLVRTVATFTVNPVGGAPTNASITVDGVVVAAGGSAAQVCNIAGDAITFSSACAAGETLLMSVDGGNYTTSSMTQIVDGSNHTYRVRCQAGSGSTACLSPESGAMIIKINPIPGVPVASLLVNGQSANTFCGGGVPQVITSNATCGINGTVWFSANNQLASLPTITSTTPGTYSFYAKCKGQGDCLSDASNTVSYTVLPVLAQPTVTSSATATVCAGTSVTFSQNCPVGSTPLWSNGSNGATLVVTQSGAGTQSVTVKCTQGASCDSPVSTSVSATWSNTFDVTIINIGQPLSGTRPGATSILNWSSNFVTPDAGSAFQNSTQSNPSIYFTEMPNKGGNRYWTIAVEACGLPLSGSISYDMLCIPETGGQYSFNTVENNAPYLMYANSNGYETLYSHNHGSFGFTSDPKYLSGLPKGLYKLSIRYWDQKGTGLFPAVRTTSGSQKAYGEYWFRIQSQSGIGIGAAREGINETSEVEFATVAPNPVTRTLTVSISGAKGQEVKMNLVDAAGRVIKTSTVTPETNTHREEIDMTSQNTGMYFMNISTSTKRANLKVLKVSQD
ncbi:T9SS type A sorting domain-containing protein [Runella sp.]|uniref:Ig-like domain-containing protein n=1 Tax=Runella sp. TaxID=1960881 RepID=UPI0026270F90|nr:T9SS type A sorting domain-containing protein [Runella sp.]